MMSKKMPRKITEHGSFSKKNTIAKSNKPQQEFSSGRKKASQTGKPRDNPKSFHKTSGYKDQQKSLSKTDALGQGKNSDPRRSQPSFSRKDAKGNDAEKKTLHNKKTSFSKNTGSSFRDKSAGSEKRKSFIEKKDSYGRKKHIDNKSVSFPPLPKYDIKKASYSKKGIEKHSSNSEEIRLNRYIANAGVCSRREADTLIELGEISVNGKIVTELGFKVNRNDIVRYNNRVLNPEKFVYVILNKPKDFITTTEDPQDRKTVMALVANACKERIYPVGRLDRNTTGLLLLTNDGELATKLMHPSSNIKKLYQADLDQPLSREDFEKILNGLELEDGKVHVDALAYVSQDKRSIGIEIHEGRNRIVRRIFEHLGYEVVRLDRVLYAGITKKDLPRGQWRFLTPKEVIQLKHLL